MTVITIDGPAGSGKSTIGRELAARLGYIYLDTGAMYRAVAWAARENGLDIKDEKAIAVLLEQIELDFDFRSGRVAVNNKDVSYLLRSPEMDALSSAVSRLGAVRNHLTHLQRQAGQNGDIVAEGRDMGTVVFPDADFKFFLTADIHERAARRKGQLDALNKTVAYEDILAQISLRDEADSKRTLSPLGPASDAVVIDTTGLMIDDVLKKILTLIKIRQ